MSISTFAALQDKLLGPTQRLEYVRNAIAPVQTTGGALILSEWSAGQIPNTLVVPTTAEVCTSAMPGALGQANKAGTQQRCWLDRFDVPFTQAGGGIYLLVDRLVHCGGLDATVTTPQLNAPTGWPALTRHTDGVGVVGAVEINSSIGATATTATVNYTSDSGGASVSQPFDFGGSGRNNQRRIIPFSLAAGDRGVKAISSITLAASTGTAGDFGLVLYKVLGMWACTSTVPVSPSGHPIRNGGPMPVIDDDACLQLMWIGGNNFSTVLMGAVFNFFED